MSKTQSFLCRLLGCSQDKHKPPGRFNWAIGLSQRKRPAKEGHMLEVTITNEQKIKATLIPVTATGKPARLDGPPTWTVQSGDSTVKPAADGLSADLISSDTPGDTLFLVEADADLGSGVEKISDGIRLTVEGARASNLGLSLGVAESKGAS